MTSRNSGWADRALLRGTLIRLRDAIRAIEMSMAPKVKRTEMVISVEYMAPEPDSLLAYAAFDESEPRLELDGSVITLHELEAVRDWADAVIARVRQQREQQQAEAERN